jgi:hypothetical protein
MSTSSLGGRAALGVILQVLGVTALAQTSEPASTTVVVTACDPAADAFLGDATDARRAASATVPLDEPYKIGAVLKAEAPSPDMVVHERALFYLPTDQSSLLLNSVFGTLLLGPEKGLSGRSLRLSLDVKADAPGRDGAPAGHIDWIDIYRSGDERTLLVDFSDNQDATLAVMALVRGTGRIARTQNGIELTVAEGEFECSVSRPASAVLTLRAGTQNAVTVTAAGFGPPRSDPAIGDVMTAARGALVKASLLRDFASVAEETAEGSLEPPASGSPVTGGAALVFARVTEIVPRGTGFTSLSLAASSARAQGIFGTQSTAERFLGQNNAALAVVGARLQNTRVIANTTGGGALSISNEATPRFGLGRR